MSPHNLIRINLEKTEIISSWPCCRRGEHDGDRVEQRHAALLLRLLALHPVPAPVHREGGGGGGRRGKPK